MNKYIYLTLFGTALSSGLFCQDDILSNFKATTNGRDVALRWIIEKGSTCDGIDILRSADSTNYIQIGKIEGVCGDVDREVTYTYIDESPINNSTNYYRLKLGLTGLSRIISISIKELGDDGYRVSPNPFYDETTIDFYNSTGEFYEISLYNIEGKLSHRQESRESNFRIVRDQLQAGMYLFIIENNENKKLVSGKLIVRN